VEGTSVPQGFLKLLKKILINPLLPSIIHFSSPQMIFFPLKDRLWSTLKSNLS
jgi:hypothetical protein